MPVWLASLLFRLRCFALLSREQELQAALRRARHGLLRCRDGKPGYVLSMHYAVRPDLAVTSTTRLGVGTCADYSEDGRLVAVKVIGECPRRERRRSPSAVSWACVLAVVLVVAVGFEAWRKSQPKVRVESVPGTGTYRTVVTVPYYHGGSPGK